MSQKQKGELQTHMIKAVSGDMEEAMIAVRKAISFALKDIKGVFYYEGDDKREYQLEFDGDNLKDNCLDDLLNLPISNKLNAVCSALLQGVPNKIYNNEGKEIEGIQIMQRGESNEGK